MCGQLSFARGHVVRHIGPQCTMHPLRASGPVHVCHTSSSSRFDFRATPHRHSVIARVSASVPGPDDKTLPSSASAAQPVASLSAPASGTSSPDAGVGSNEQEQKPLGLFQRIKRYFVGDKADKQKLAALGMGAFLAYGVVSNLTYGTCFTIAWMTMVKTTGYSPIMPGQWPTFLGYYAGLWAIQNLLRPLRIPLAIAMAPPFEGLMQRISESTGLKKRWAFGIMLGLVATCTISILGSALFLLGGFPPIPPEILKQSM